MAQVRRLLSSFQKRCRSRSAAGVSVLGLGASSVVLPQQRSSACPVCPCRRTEAPPQRLCPAGAGYSLFAGKEVARALAKVAVDEKECTDKWVVASPGTCAVAMFRSAHSCTCISLQMSQQKGVGWGVHTWEELCSR